MSESVIPIGLSVGTATKNAPPDTQHSAQQSVQLKAQLKLREMILAGELPGGARIAELSIVEKLGFSRTPIRAALMRLEQESPGT